MLVDDTLLSLLVRHSIHLGQKTMTYFFKTATFARHDPASQHLDQNS
jgi:hypothetical protein